MSRFADRTATGRLVLNGGCQCPGAPHDEDWIELRTQLGGADVVAVSEGTGIDAAQRLIVAWNLLTDDGSEAPVDREHIEDLYTDVFDELDTWIEANVSLRTLPNVSSVHSPNGSLVNASSRRGKRTGR